MAGINRAYAPYEFRKGTGRPCVFISYRLLDSTIAAAVAEFFMKVVDCDVYFSEQDAGLKEGLFYSDDQKIADSIDKGLLASSHVLGIITANTRGSWRVPYEFGGARHRESNLAVLVTEDVPDLPSYMKIAKQLSDRSDLVAWARSVVAASSPMTLSKSRETLATPTVPRVPHYRAAVPYRAQLLG